jgi:poly(3-hydroxybutyrate) depolymerase
MPDDISRGSGEAESIRQMTEHAIARYGVDRRRVFVTGLSAGGAMASVMLATYPETYAAGAIVAGLPYGCAGSVQEAFEAMFSDKNYSARALGDKVRQASSHSGPWPAVTVWHGTADAIVKPSNADHIVRQWSDVHGLSPEPSQSEMIGSHARRVWRDAQGRPAVEAYVIAGMPHAVPLDLNGSAAEVGAVGPFFLDVGVSSTLMSARAWGLADVSYKATGKAAGMFGPGVGGAPGQFPTGSPADIVAAAMKAAGLPAGDGTKGSLPGAGIDPQAIVDAALRQAGLKR